MTAKPKTYGAVQIDNACRLGHRVTCVWKGHRRRVMGLSVVDPEAKERFYIISFWFKKFPNAITKHLDSFRIEEAK